MMSSISINCVISQWMPSLALEVSLANKMLILTSSAVGQRLITALCMLVGWLADWLPGWVTDIEEMLVIKKWQYKRPAAI